MGLYWTNLPIRSVYLRGAVHDFVAFGADIVFCSSKTRSEQTIIQAELGVHHPFIAENGSAIYIPLDAGVTSKTGNALGAYAEILILGMPLDDLRVTLRKVVRDTEIRYQSFYDISVQQVAELTGLDLASAARAKEREFTETIVTHLDETQLRTFVTACELYGLQCSQGGRFLSVSKKGADKGTAVKLLTKRYAALYGDVVTIGIGDSPNDEPMLQSVDLAFLVQRREGVWTSLHIDRNVTLIPAVGPLGFVEMARIVLEQWSNLATFSSD